MKRKTLAVSIRPIFRVQCSECPNFVRIEKSTEFDPKIDFVTVHREMRDAYGWMFVSFGRILCRACRPTERTFPDPADDVVPQINLPDPLYLEDEEGFFVE